MDFDAVFCRWSDSRGSLYVYNLHKMTEKHFSISIAPSYGYLDFDAVVFNR
jgi:hypothetical protein